MTTETKKYNNNIIATFVSAIAYFGVKSMVPLNGYPPTFRAPKNNFC
jgi:hypothetical protein